MSQEFTRRRALQTAAWSTPVLIAAFAAPASAASNGLFIAYFVPPASGNGLRTITLTVENNSSSTSGLPEILVISPGASLIGASLRPAAGWTATALPLGKVLFTLDQAMAPGSSASMEFDLLVDSEDDLLLIGELTDSQGVRYGFTLSR